jgi:hypothetical protein
MVYGSKSLPSTTDRKKYKYNRPGFEEAFYGAWSVEVIDPFGNKILFNEKKRNTDKEQQVDTTKDERPLKELRLERQHKNKN